jgi:hypothetical protein
VAEWLRSLTSSYFPLTAMGSNIDRDFDFFHVRKLSSQLTQRGGSTQVPVRAWNNARRGTWGLPPPVKLERRDMTYTVSMWRNTPKQTDKQINVITCLCFALSSFCLLSCWAPCLRPVLIGHVVSKRHLSFLYAHGLYYSRPPDWVKVQIKIWKCVFWLLVIIYWGIETKMVIIMAMGVKYVI